MPWGSDLLGPEILSVTGSDFDIRWARVYSCHSATVSFCGRTKVLPNGRACLFLCRNASPRIRKARAMKGSLERIRRVITLQKPDRAPLFDVLHNDAVLCYFNDGEPIKPGDKLTGLRAVAKAIDGAPSLFAPNLERVERLEDGREVRYERWTTWVEPKHEIISSEEYRQRKTRELSGWRDAPERTSDSTGSDHPLIPETLTSCSWYVQQRETRAALDNELGLTLAVGSPGLMLVWLEYGLEAFSYFLYDCEDLIVEQLERNTVEVCRWAESLPEDDPFEMVFIGEDIAFRSGPMIDPEWTRKYYFPRLRRVTDAFHTCGKKVLFHSDGNLNLIMDDLVEAGVDAIHPVEVLAGMNLADLHRRYPKLVFAGGIDTSQLLPFGKPQQIRDAVVRAIEDTEGQILVGSSSEVHNLVPLENFLALRETAMSYRF